MQDRHPSVSFNSGIKLDSGHRQSMEEPLEKPSKPRERGRSMLSTCIVCMPRPVGHPINNRPEDFLATRQQKEFYVQ
jgi:hypothetical protein